MGNSSWISGIVIAAVLACIALPGRCQRAQASDPVFSVKLSVDSGESPFSVVLHGGELPYLARREATRASSVKFTDLQKGTYRAVVDLPGGRRAERLVEVQEFNSSKKNEVRASLALADFRTVPHKLEHEMHLSVDSFPVENEVARLLKASWPLMEKGELTAAHALLRRAVTLDPEFHEGWNNLGAVAERQGALEEAVHFYREALRLEPDCFLANMNLSIVLTQLQHFPEALVFGRRAIESYPDSLVARLHIATICLRAQAYRDAIPHLQEVIALNGEQTDTPRLQLAVAYSESNQYGMAVLTLREWMRVHPRHPRFRLVEAAIEDLVALIDR
ncbi:MAG: tetratricopeptide repeat protein [Bryobacterales bacterium]|nr:tetratricopeptide repeat protein [Bryobacterales bacterium]